jgi:hypothetical protein
MQSIFPPTQHFCKIQIRISDSRTPKLTQNQTTAAAAYYERSSPMGYVRSRACLLSKLRHEGLYVCARICYVATCTMPKLPPQDATPTCESSTDSSVPVSISLIHLRTAQKLLWWAKKGRWWSLEQALRQGSGGFTIRKGVGTYFLSNVE